MMILLLQGFALVRVPAFMFLLCFLLGAVGLPSGFAEEDPFPSSEKERLAKSWAAFKETFIQRDGRVIRPWSKNDTVSEGQAYAMLWAVFMDDQQTFDRCYKWCESNISRRRKKGDHLLAWRWGQDGDGRWRTLDDWSSASDADQDYAAALIFASKRWEKPRKWFLTRYDEKAKLVLADILEHETAMTPAKRIYVLPGDWGKSEDGAITINPSYFSPAWFRMFYNETGDKRWNTIIDSGYEMLNKLAERFNGQAGVGLVPDWCRLLPNGEFVPLEEKSQYYGWDVVRVPWRIGLDFIWHRDERAGVFLKKHWASFIEKELMDRGELLMEYYYNGEPAAEEDRNAIAHAMAYVGLVAIDSVYQDVVYDRVMADFRMEESTAHFGEESDYYANSLCWYVFALRSGMLAKGFSVKSPKR